MFTYVFADLVQYDRMIRMIRMTRRAGVAPMPGRWRGSGGFYAGQVARQGGLAILEANLNCLEATMAQHWFNNAQPGAANCAATAATADCAARKREHRTSHLSL